ncbi:glycosyltransferase [Argonema galeatum]|uniref:glycosyltransferase n=1 Tax=Argonema galeatum TaxID=2942762 RepID=UPI0020125E28|nr:glycosyltransferase [Argonema galeatum]MCL1467697.1 glycosyltransferase [Argonema galeatum A003/A1]
MNSEQQKYKLALLVNTIAPYRLPIYQTLGSYFNLSIFHGGDEQNRSGWQNVESKLSNIKVKRSWGITLQWRQGKKGGTYDRRFTHITPGYLLDLWKFRPDAIVTNEMGFRSLAALIYGTIFGIPVWVWWGGTLHTEISRKLFKKALRRLFIPWVKHWISYGETSTEYLLSLGIPKNKILQIQNCVDEQLYLEPKAPKVQRETKPVFLYVGQMINRKGVDKLLEAAFKVQQEGHRFSLLLVGGGPEKTALEALAQKLNLQNVTFYPPQPPDVMPSIYCSADYLVFPTLEDVWGLVVNEALWSGVPVLSSIYAGCSKELLPSQNIFDPLNEDDFVATLKRALAGEVAYPDHSRLKTCAEVAEMIINDIKSVLK